MNQQAEFESDLYRFDGRSYDLEEDAGELTLRLRRSALNERRFKVLGSLFLAAFVSEHLVFTQSGFGMQFRYTFLVCYLGFLFLLFVAYLAWSLFTNEVWKFSPNGLAQLKKGRNQPRSWSGVKAIHARQKGKRFFISFEINDGQIIQIGAQRYSTCEAPWRTDAELIATRLGVPLSIPPI